MICIHLIFSKLENASCTYTYDATAESFLNKAGDLYNIISKSISDVTGRNSPPEQATDGGTSDARYIKNYCEVVELGLRNQTLHKVDEFVFVEDIIKLENIYFRILENYFDVN
jgi:succinyl-diaminopimelate desuccinylase